MVSGCAFVFAVLIAFFKALTSPLGMLNVAALTPQRRVNDRLQITSSRRMVGVFICCGVLLRIARERVATPTRLRLRLGRWGDPASRLRSARDKVMSRSRQRVRC